MTLRQSLRTIVLLALFALPALAGDNHWTIKGPDGGSVNKLVFDSQNPSIVYATSDNGIFRSVDGGQHWVAAAAVLGTPFTDIAVAISDPGKVFASSVYGLYKSTDRGVTWFQIPGSFASYAVAFCKTNADVVNADVVYSNSGGGPFRSSDDGITFANVGAGLPSSPSAVSALAIDPLRPDTVYAAYQTSAGVYKSVDGGGHWTAANSGLTSTAYFSMVIDPSNGSTLYVAGTTGLFKTTDGGNSWTPLTNGLQASGYVLSLSISAGPPSTILAGTNSGLFKSTDGGASWTGPNGFNGSTVAPVAVDPVNPANFLVTANFLTFRSTNGGTSFAAASSGLAAFYTQAIAVDPQNESTVYASGPSGISKSTDRGENWATLLTTPTGSIAVDSQNSQTIYANPSGVVRRSLDGGATWQDYSTGLPSGSASFIVADPRVQGTIYTFLGTAVYKRVGSDPWVKMSTGFPASLNFSSITFLVIDPNNSSTLYAGGGIGVFKSTDGGVSWNAANGGLTGVSTVGLAVDPFDSRHLLTWSNSSGYESTDSGATWVSFANPGDRQGIHLTFDPSSPGRIYDSATDGSGLFATIDRSNDGGKNWFPMQTGLGKTPLEIFVVAPGGSILYAGSTRGGVWVFHIARSRAVSK